MGLAALRRGWLLLGLAILVMAGVVGGVVRLRALEATAAADWEARVAAAAEGRRELVDHWLAERFGDAREAALGVELNPAPVGGALSPAAWAYRRTGFLGLAGIDARGDVWVPDSTIILSANERTALGPAAASLTERVEGPWRAADGRFRVLVASPLQGRRAVVMAYDAASSLYPLVQLDPGDKGTLHSALLRRIGDAVEVVGPGSGPQGLSFGRRWSRSEMPQSWRTALGGAPAVTRGRGPLGEAAITAAYPVVGSPWLLTTTITEAEALAVARGRFRMEATAVLLLFLGSLGALAFARLDFRRRELALERHAQHFQEQLSLETARRQLDQRFRAMFHSAALGIALVDRQWRVSECNDALHQLLGCRSGRLVGRDLTFMVKEDSDQARSPLLHATRELIAGRIDSSSMSLALRRVDGRSLWGTVTVSLLDAANPTEGLLVMVQDTTAAHDLELQLTHRAFHDSLTNLANRALLLDRTEHALRTTVRHGAGVAMLFIDLDEFKPVNDAHGHEAGDRLLVAVAERLKRAARESDTVARLAGDEFAVLLETGVDDDQAQQIAQRMLQAVVAPLDLGATHCFPSASIGIAVSTGEESADELLRHADLAMYRAKQRGRGRIERYVAGLSSAVSDRLALEADLRHALERREFVLEYQPVLDAGDGRLLGMEALLRWQHPTRGLVPPGAFVHLAEASGLIVPIGAWVVGEACRGLAELRARLSMDDPGGLTVSVNLSAAQLEDDALVARVQEALANHRLPASSLVLEITESVVMRQVSVALTRMRALRALGVRLAIDDFGTGYSSLSYLRELPVQILKIDKSFIDALEHSTAGAALARTIIALGDMMGLTCVAEGVERASQLSTLRELGCTAAQGFHLGRPMPLAELAEGRWRRAFPEVPAPGDDPEGASRGATGAFELMRT